LQEFYQVTFYGKRYRNLESSQIEMDRHLIIIMKVLIKANQQWQISCEDFAQQEANLEY